jgi:chromosome segregation ATPase
MNEKPILAPDEREQMETLRTKELQGITLTLAEKSTLTALYKRIEDYEAAYLRPANERAEARIAEKEQRIAALEALLERKAQALARLEMLVREIDALKIEEQHLRAIPIGKAS